MVQMRIGPAHRHLNYRVQFAERGVAPYLNRAPDGWLGAFQRHFDLVNRDGDLRRRSGGRRFITGGLPRRSFSRFCGFSRRHFFSITQPRRVSGGEIEQLLNFIQLITLAVFVRRAKTASVINNNNAANSSRRHTRWRDSISSLLSLSFAAAPAPAFGSAPVVAVTNASTSSLVKSDSLPSRLTAAKSEFPAYRRR